jgi:hypothetical protein
VFQQSFVPDGKFIGVSRTFFGDPRLLSGNSTRDYETGRGASSHGARPFRNFDYAFVIA